MPREISRELMDKRNDLCGPMVLFVAYGGPSEQYYETIKRYANELDVASNSGTNWHQMIEHVIQSGFSFSFKIDASYKDLIKTSQQGVTIVGTTEWANETRSKVSHLAVVQSANRSSVTLIDPAPYSLVLYQTRRLSRQQFMRRWHDDEAARAFLVIQQKRATKK